MTTVNAPEFVRHPKLIAWVEEIANLTKPAKIEWCDGSEEEHHAEIKPRKTSWFLSCKF